MTWWDTVMRFLQPKTALESRSVEREVEIAAYKADVSREVRAYRGEVAKLRRAILRAPAEQIEAMLHWTGQGRQ